MLKRALENQLDDKLVFMLGKGLGEINRTRLKNYGEATKAYKIAIARKPDDVETHQILAQLYELEENYDAAIRQFSILLTFDARSIETYRSLKRLYLEQGKYDAAWCVCQAPVCLAGCKPRRAKFFQKRRARSLRGSTPLASQHWSLVTHPKKSGLLDQLFAYLYPILMPAMARNLKEFGLHKRKSVLDLKTERPVTIVLKHISSLTGLECPTVYHGMDKVSGMLNINTAPPSIVAGAQSLDRVIYSNFALT